MYNLKVWVMPNLILLWRNTKWLQIQTKIKIKLIEYTQAGVGTCEKTQDRKGLY